MKYVNIKDKKPSYKEPKYLAQVKTKETTRAWYKPGYFAKQAA